GLSKVSPVAPNIPSGCSEGRGTTPAVAMATASSATCGDTSPTHKNGVSLNRLIRTWASLHGTPAAFSSPHANNSHPFAVYTNSLARQPPRVLASQHRAD